MRVKAPIDTSHVRDLHLRTALACDPIKAQYKRASTNDESVIEQIGIFRAWDPEYGAWPFSAQQRGIMEEVVAKIEPDWVSNVLIPMVDMTDSRTEPSLRLIDWFVTNYSKSQGVAINGSNIHVDYIDVRRAYQCRNFDPFRRNLKLNFMSPAPENKSYYTTVGQVNFLLWAHSTGVLQYVRIHRAKIDEDMCGVCKRTRQQRQKCKENGTKRKRTALSKDRSVKCRITKSSDPTITYSTKKIRM